jgi:hypothetical protein
MEIGTAPRLTIELVPKTCWFSNVRSRVSPRDWDRIRYQVYEEAGHRCEVCRGRGSRHVVECHELWEYDERRGIQRLVRMVALCPACHEVKHIGLAQIKARGDIAEAHLAAINDWTADQASHYVADAFALWRERSTKDWTLDVAVLTKYGIEAAVATEGDSAADARSRAADAATAKVRRAEQRRPQ